MLLNIFAYFTDPILRAPTIGCMLMCLAASLMGVVIFLRKESLIGEALSHAAYPGVILGVILAGSFWIREDQELQLSILILICAFFTGMLGLWMIQWMNRSLKVAKDAALCFVLSTFFGVGLMLASNVQFNFTTLYKQVLSYLYGQAATMTDIHIIIYGILALIVIVIIIAFYKELQILTFDRAYAKSLGVKVNMIDAFLTILVTLSVIIGIRSVGVVLMSAMLIAPAIAARQLTNKLSLLFFLSAFFGLLSGFFGNYFSVELTEISLLFSPMSRVIFPTGPMIVLTASIIAFFSLLMAPKRGLFARWTRIFRFRYICTCENILKTMWKIADHPCSLKNLDQFLEVSPIYLKLILWRMKKNGWVKQLNNQRYSLTKDGKNRAVKIVRLHRLWELYLTNYLGIGVEKVHRNAEEMEHIITPEIEKELTLILKDPKKDPHEQPIPPMRGGFHAL